MLTLDETLNHFVCVRMHMYASAEYQDSQEFVKQLRNETKKLRGCFV